MQDEVVYPIKTRGDPAIGPVALITAMEKDLALIRRSMGIEGKAAGKILSSKLYRGVHGHQDVALAGPLLGAPYAVMVLEKLIALGAKRILFFGWCGSIRQGLSIGDFLVPDRAVSDEGTSAHYPVNDPYPRPSGAVLKAIEETLVEYAIPFHKGPICSTDAPYRETRQKVLRLQREEVLALDMELSALFTVASFRQAEIGALLVVSDELGSLRWRPGFSSGKFNRSRKMAAEVVHAICQKL